MKYKSLNMKKSFLIRVAIMMISFIAGEKPSAQVIVVPAGQRTVIQRRPVTVQKHYPRYYRRSYHPAYYQRGYYRVKRDNGRHKGWYKHNKPYKFKKHH